MYTNWRKRYKAAPSLFDLVIPKPLSLCGQIKRDIGDAEDILFLGEIDRLVGFNPPLEHYQVRPLFEVGRSGL